MYCKRKPFPYSCLWSSTTLPGRPSPRSSLRLRLRVLRTMSGWAWSNTPTKRTTTIRKTTLPGDSPRKDTLTSSLSQVCLRLLPRSQPTLRNRRFSSCARTQIVKVQALPLMFLPALSPHLTTMLVQARNDLWFYQKCLLETMSFTLLLPPLATISFWSSNLRALNPTNQPTGDLRAKLKPGRNPSAAPTLGVTSPTTNCPISRHTTEFILVNKVKYNRSPVIIISIFRWETFQLSVFWLWQNLCPKWWVVSSQESSHWRKEVCVFHLQQTFRTLGPSPQTHEETREEDERCKTSWTKSKENCQNSSQRSELDFLLSLI